MTKNGRPPGSTFSTTDSTAANRVPRLTFAQPRIVAPRFAEPKGRFLPEQWRKALAFGEAESYPPGETLIRAGAVNADVFLIIEGVVNLIVTDSVDGQTRPVCWRSAGHFVGDSSAILKAPSAVAVRTATSCLVYRVSAVRFVRALELNCCPVLWQFLEAKCRDILEMLGTIATTSSSQAQRRLGYVLGRLAEQQRVDNTDPETRLTHYSPSNRELAQYVGVNTNYIPALLAGLNRAGFVRRDRGRLVVSKILQLHQEAPSSLRGLRDNSRLRTLLGIGAPRRIDAGYMLFCQGEPTDDVYLIDQGFVTMSASAEFDPGDVDTSIYWLSSGQLVGDSAAITGSSQLLTAKTRSRCFVHHIPGKQLLQYFTGDPDDVVLQLLSHENDWHADLVTALILRQSGSVRDRLTSVLLRLAKQTARETSHGIVHLDQFSPSNATLAGYIGSEERYVSELMQDFRRQGLAWRGSNKIITICLSGTGRPKGACAAGCN